MLLLYSNALDMHGNHVVTLRSHAIHDI